MLPVKPPPPVTVYPVPFTRVVETLEEFTTTTTKSVASKNWKFTT
jgi:hypothetical protein